MLKPWADVNPAFRVPYNPIILQFPNPTAEAAPAASHAAPKVASELNGLAIFWALLKNWVSGLFGKRT